MDPLSRGRRRAHARCFVFLVIGQSDTTALGKTWAPAAVKEKMGRYPELGRKAKAAIPDCRLVEIEGAGHLPQVQRFEQYWRALEDFLYWRLWSCAASAPW